MRIVTCASFYGSGSSAITDLLSEYKQVKGLSENEFRFLHDPDGVSDLEFNLLECHNRHNSGHALKRFLDMSYFNLTKMNSPYRKTFGKNYYKLSKDYVDSLTDYSFKGWWFYDLYDKGWLGYHILQITNHFSKILLNRNILPNEVTYLSHPTEEKFLECTRKYVHDLIDSVRDKDHEFVMVDQLVSSQNIGRMLRYFSDPIDIFVVNRDPRDLYLSHSLYWKNANVPILKPVEFCNWYRYTRESGNTKEHDYNLPNVHSIRFEDLIFKYDETVSKIESGLGLSASDHVKQFELFNPSRSVANTQVWKKHEYKEDIKIIENMLPEYLYDFDSVKSNSIPGPKPDSQKVF